MIKAARIVDLPKDFVFAMNDGNGNFDGFVAGEELPDFESKPEAKESVSFLVSEGKIRESKKK